MFKYIGKVLGALTGLFTAPITAMLTSLVKILHRPVNTFQRLYAIKRQKGGSVLAAILIAGFFTPIVTPIIWIADLFRFHAQNIATSFSKGFKSGLNDGFFKTLAYPYYSGKSHLYFLEVLDEKYVDIDEDDDLILPATEIDNSITMQQASYRTANLRILLSIDALPDSRIKLLNASELQQFNQHIQHTQEPQKAALQAKLDTYQNYLKSQCPIRLFEIPELKEPLSIEIKSAKGGALTYETQAIKDHVQQNLLSKVAEDPGSRFALNSREINIYKGYASYIVDFIKYVRDTLSATPAAEILKTQGVFKTITPNPNQAQAATNRNGFGSPK